MRFAISIPQFFADGEFDPAAFRTYLTRAEELGFHSGWTQEQVLGSAPNLGPIETMTYAAACTERLRLGCAVFVSTLHNPLHLAKSISTLDQLSRGRLEVGVGTGGRGRAFAAFGIDTDAFVARFTEGIRLMKACWTETEIAFPGRFWQLDGQGMEPKPFQKPHPPLWFGGNHPNAIRRAVRYGDGFFGAGSQTTAQFTDQARVVREALDEAGRDPEGFRLAKRVYIAVDDDAARARRRMTDALNRLYGRSGDDDLTPVAVFGPPDECVTRLREVADAGAEMILFTTLFDEADQMERLAAEVMPHLS
ncbi:LLM class flavin-dependent oxidoreductase [Actinoallomurus rhizosphaericola]|uniref:LLM class flavin-dependent oxidoreductase n=1 Tax=Actinoallomurus rhizosphaericola TaxID=2952536 RepID=UPI002091DFF7|nr:LLM class flavin-dependent oxidoreductase [Actinoallomurus rhizosphaericola]MCO5994503.1 LLM class flavin-dependent oxidoreductase [Actinoallomurus rhizosphaericola]